MKELLKELTDQLDNERFTRTSVMNWASPVPMFGDLAKSKTATIGLNPSNLEFVDQEGKELEGVLRRFHTLKSLNIESWKETTLSQIDSIIELCSNYFNRNPYDGWFKKLDYIISGSNTSYYFPSSQACHLDLVPYATSVKWGELSLKEKSDLLKLSGDSLGLLLKSSEIDLIILNGKSVVDSFKNIADCDLHEACMPEWTLPRKSGNGVLGYSYQGEISAFGEVKLKRKIKVLGFNHNIQSSFGVTKQIKTSIRNWVTESINE